VRTCVQVCVRVYVCMCGGLCAIVCVMGAGFVFIEIARISDFARRASAKCLPPQY